MSNKKVDWQGTADALDNLTDEELNRAAKILNPSGKTAGEEVDEALKRFTEMGLFDAAEDEDFFGICKDNDEE